MKCEIKPLICIEKLKLGSIREILLWRWKFKLSPRLFPGDIFILPDKFLIAFKNIFHHACPTKKILSVFLASLAYSSFQRPSRTRWKGH